MTLRKIFEQFSVFMCLNFLSTCVISVTDFFFKCVEYLDDSLLKYLDDRERFSELVA